MSYFQDRLKLYGFVEVPEVARAIKKRVGGVPNGFKVYRSRGGNHELYLRGRRDLDLGKIVGDAMFRKIRKHYHVMNNIGSYAHTHKEVEEIAEKREQSEKAEKDERMRYMAKEYWKYGIRGSSGGKAPSVVVDGLKGA